MDSHSSDKIHYVINQALKMLVPNIEQTGIKRY